MATCTSYRAWIRFLTVVVVYCVVVHAAFAKWANIPLDKRVADADLVVLGKITSIKPGPKGVAPFADGKNVLGEIKIAQVLKGNEALQTIDLAFRSPDLPARRDGVRYTLGQEGIWILQKDSKGDYYSANYLRDYQKSGQLAAVKAIVAKLSLEKVAPRITALLKVKIHWRWGPSIPLKKSVKGGAAASEYLTFYEGEVTEVLLGSWIVGKRITVRYSRPAAPRTRLPFSPPKAPGAGIEEGMRKGSEYLLCFERLRSKQKVQHLLRAEPLEKRKELLAAIAKVQADRKKREDEVAAKRAEVLKKSAGSFGLAVWYHGADEQRHHSVSLIGPDAWALLQRALPSLKVKWEGPPPLPLSKEQVDRIIDHLVADGFLARASDIGEKRNAPPQGPAYTMTVSGAARMQLHEVMGWNLEMLERLDTLHAVLDGDAAGAMKKLIDALAEKRKEWEAARITPKPLLVPITGSRWPSQTAPAKPGALVMMIGPAREVTLERVPARKRERASLVLTSAILGSMAGGDPLTKERISLLDCTVERRSGRPDHRVRIGHLTEITVREVDRGEFNEYSALKAYLGHAKATREEPCLSPNIARFGTRFYLLYLRPTIPGTLGACLVVDRDHKVRPLDIDMLTTMHRTEYPASLRWTDHDRLMGSFIALHAVAAQAVISSADEMFRGPTSVKPRPLSDDLKKQIRAPYSFEKDGDLIYVYFAYQQIGGILRKYTFTFEGRVTFKQATCEKLGQGLGRALHLE